MRGAPVHLASLGAAGSEMLHFGGLGVNMENAICLPSGDQRASPILVTAWVTWLAEPSTSIQRTKTCAWPSASAI